MKYKSLSFVTPNKGFIYHFDMPFFSGFVLEKVNDFWKKRYYHWEIK